MICVLIEGEKIGCSRWSGCALFLYNYQVLKQPPKDFGSWEKAIQEDFVCNGRFNCRDEVIADWS